MQSEKNPVYGRLAKSVRDHLETARGQTFKNMINVYRCETCIGVTVTKDVDAGVTPFLIRCPHCKGTARSALYQVKQELQHTHEWYRPDTLEEYRALDRATRQHVEMGGLLLRERAANG